MQLTCRSSLEIKASCPNETLVDYELVRVLFIAYNVLPAEKYDDREERLVWEVRTGKQNQRILKSQLCKNPLSVRCSGLATSSTAWEYHESYKATACKGH